MTWNYRVVHHLMDETDYYGIHEVYYDEDGRPQNVTVDPMDVGWEESVKGVAQTLKWMRKALKQPVLEYEDFAAAGGLDR